VISDADFFTENIHHSNLVSRQHRFLTGTGSAFVELFLGIIHDRYFLFRF